MNQNPFLKSWGSLFKERAVPKPSGITRAAYAEASDLRSWPFRPWIALVFLLIFQACGSSAAVLLPLEFQQGVTFYNFQSARGVPISTTKNVPPGSDGRMPTVNESAGSLLLPTTNQFQGFIGFGAVATRTNPAAVANSPILNGSNAFSAAVASAMQLPMASSDGSVLMVLRRAQVGAPYLSRQVSFAFGAVVSVPSVDENGNTLTNIVPEAYWAAEPYTTNSHAGSGYYWSPNARKVYAIQPGPIKVTWVKSAYATGAHPPATNGVSYITNSTGNIFTLYTANYLVSGAPVKPPRRMYWTEKSFRTIGKPVAVPTARVGSVYIVYNSNFPQTVTNEYVAPGDSSPTDGTGSQTLPILRTLWYESGNFLAYNVEGRVFVELLGDARQDGTREQLGFEIVDVYKQPALLDVTVELGDRILPPAPGRLEELTPDPILQPSGPDFAYQHSPGGNVALYAARETSNVNDYLVHWLEEGLVGIKWPALLGRYKMVWPTDPARYSHYVRPRVATENEARTTAVPLPTQNVPVIQYQDPLDKPRGKLTETFAFYTFLEPPYSAHRTLLRFSSGENVYFERVFSWLDSELKTSNFANNPIVTNLPAWDRTNNVFEWPDVFTAPRVLIGEGVVVGDRIVAPYGEAGDQFFDPNYLAGYIKQSAGTSFNPHTYVDPFVSGFEAANKGAIIPVNAIPGSNTLEVWWFRRNPDNSAKGFLPIYWPSVVSQYNILWPEENERVPREIVLASNKGSEGDGPLDTFEANGRIYYQNDRNQVGYNPNEEHAIMSAGTVFATRDDLNITNSTSFSSMPYVLIEYTDGDGRPSMTIFRVNRERPERGWVFDYIVEAGKLLQPPMPLPLLAKPVEGTGENAINYNTEPLEGAGDLPRNWLDSRDATGPYAYYRQFTYRDRKNDFWVYRGLHSGLPVLQVGRYDTTNQTFGPLSGAVAVVGEPFSYALHASRQDEFLSASVLNGPGWLQSRGLILSGTPSVEDVGSNVVTIVTSDTLERISVTNTMVLQVLSNGTLVAQSPLVLASTNGYTGSIVNFSNRPPFLAYSPDPSNSFTMRFYYKTEPSFAWPASSTPPPAGSIVPYLRKVTNGQFVGDPSAKTTPSLDIVYRPVWPERDPKDSSKPVATMSYGYTLVMPDKGLPGIRDFKTARVLYQQSIGTNIAAANPAVYLHDATREKVSDLKAQSLDVIPGSIRTDYYQGKYYFPNLPPHLAARVFFDPNRGQKGALVLKGEFHDEVFGDDYILLNVLRDSDLNAVLGLCPVGDTENYPKWASLVNALATGVETFYENPTKPGTYIPNTNLTVSVAVSNLAVITSDNMAVDSYALSATGPGAGYVTLVESGGRAFTQPGDPVALHIFRVVPELFNGQLKVIPAANPLSEQVTFQHTLDLAGRSAEFEYEWQIGAPVEGNPPSDDNYLALASGTGLPRYTLGGAGIQVLGDNYIKLRYRPTNPAHPLYHQWSEWTSPQLAEGWIKRVLAGINPFNQRITDLFNNTVNTDASILSQAGHRWEGDIALNLDTINNYGLIEIYETVLRRGRSISIESGFNYGPANDALLLASGYLNDLYMMLGNEAWADAANPTIGIGTANNTYGDIATALYSFKGQVPSLLEEELALLRGRDDFLQPGVEIAPIYNRLVWNYTRGIDSGEVIYALNYNIQEDPNRAPDGVINAADAARMFPQGHGDAYGHYLTALKGYYSLLMNENFDWVPRSEAVLVLGQPVSVDYQDERKFAAAAAALARSGRQIFDLTWRRDYQSGHKTGWSHFETSRVNTQRKVATTRYWGMDHWANRTVEGAYLDWVIGNALLPAVDPNPNHEGIQKIDRTTVPELSELATLAEGMNSAMDNAENGMTPLGLPENSVALDIDPNLVVGSAGGTHFDQIYGRAKQALENALAAFDDAKDVTRLMRSEQDSVTSFQDTVAKQELAYTNALIEIYGTPYTDDIGPGKTYKQGYAGPDIVHYPYVEIPESTFGGGLASTSTYTYKIDIQLFPADWTTNLNTVFNIKAASSSEYSNGLHYIEFTLNPHDFYRKPSDWTGQRQSPGKAQQAISEVVRAHARLEQALVDAEYEAAILNKKIQLFNARVDTHNAVRSLERDKLIAEQTLESAKFANEIFVKTVEIIQKVKSVYADALTEAFPRELIAGLAAGGDLTSAARAAVKVADGASFSVLEGIKYAADFVVKGLEFSTTTANRWVDFEQIAPKDWDQELKTAVVELGEELGTVEGHWFTINSALRSLDDAKRNLNAVIAEGDRLQQERQIFRQRAAAVVQGYRTRDAAFRIFRNEKLERYKTLFDLAARYSFLAANAYDYETGLLNSSPGRSFVNRLVSARALGVIRNGEPQYAGSDTGDPGLSSALAEMKADWEVLRGRLGFNNPDTYGTTVSLRQENFRILPTTNSDPNWRDILNRSRVPDLMADGDVRRYCMQIDRGNGLPVPGIIIEFSTTIANGYNLFGRELAAGDHAYSPSSFATKVFATGVALEGYRGMDQPTANGGLGGTSPSDPDVWYLDPLALAATPYVYLVPVGVDSMRSPPLGDVSQIRTWDVADVAVPLPFNIGGSSLAGAMPYLSSASLTEQLFTIRKHQAFRPVPSSSIFSLDLYGVGGDLAQSQYTSSRLIGRSVWNSRWKLVIPGHTLLSDPDQGLDRFIATVRDIRLHFVTYSYSGN